MYENRAIGRFCSYNAMYYMLTLDRSGPFAH